MNDEINLIYPNKDISGNYRGICLDTYCQSPLDKPRYKLVHYESGSLIATSLKVIVDDKLVRVFKARPLDLEHRIKEK